LCRVMSVKVTTEAPHHRAGCDADLEPAPQAAACRRRR
jgi:hypothetical protein